MFLRRKKYQHFVFAALACMLFLIGFFAAQILFNDDQEAALLFRFLSPSSNSKTQLPSLSKHISGSKQLSSKDEIDDDLTLIDSILSIIQNYYVDSNRITSLHLIKGIVEGLKSDYPITLKPASEQELVIELDEEKIFFPKEAFQQYEKLLETILKISFLVENFNYKHPLGTKDEDLSNITDKAGKPILKVLSAMVLSLDAHSAILSAEMYKELKQGTEGSFGGLGVLVGMKNNLLTVVSPILNSPADRLGVLKSDAIVAIDGKETFSYHLDDLVQLMRGAPGTKVRLSLLREGALSTEEIEMQREVVLVDSVQSKVIEKNKRHFLHVSIENFAQRTDLEIKKAMNSYNKKFGSLDGMILDLRSNPGGLLDQAVKVANLFIKKGVIVSTKGRKEEVEYALEFGADTSFPMVVLINEESASASEIVAGALQDHQRALILGQPSFGKGSVQTIFELPEERAFKLTIARYCTPSGRSIQNTGIIPDIWLHPVMKKKQNSNLLGVYRYKSEQFLNHHLLADEFKENSPLIKSKKAYFLFDETLELNGKDKKHDFELAAATSLLMDFKKENNNIPERNVYEWVHLDKRSLDENLKQWNEETKNYLSQTFHIDWSTKERETIIEDGDLSFSIHQSENDDLEAESGENKKIFFTVINNSIKTFDRISLFSSMQGGDTTEQLIGQLKPKAKIQVPFMQEMPIFERKQKISLAFGLAKDARPIKLPLIEKKIKVKPREFLTFEVVDSFFDSALGQKEFILEPFEKGSIIVSIYNKSSLPGRDLIASLTSLSGEQVQVIKDKVQIKNLLPEERMQVEFQIQASDLIVSQKLRFGFLIASEDVFPPFKANITVPALPLSNTAFSLFPKPINH